MKKLLLSAVALMAFGAAAQAQEINFGVKAGANFTNIGGDFDADGKTGFYVGALADFSVSEKFHVQPELLYSNEGAEDASIDYIRIPVMAKYYVIEGLSIQAGPHFGFKVAADEEIDDNVKSFDFGLGIGAGYELPMGVFFDARYNAGLANISDFDGVDGNTTGFQIGVGYRF
ncbi:porin family protein [Flavobacterium sp. MK4S-17]|jgi:opacity protein-like surface antigen|uniref:porin family protein n=1 Tax=Flavobacterium sp. MK4S-17 TaxID=2543737 RepID=UPI00135BDD5E|nr:porin family protein [Flavobacterium sp. MK4S-17]